MHASHSLLGWNRMGSSHEFASGFTLPLPLSVSSLQKCIAVLSCLYNVYSFTGTFTYVEVLTENCHSSHVQTQAEGRLGDHGLCRWRVCFLFLKVFSVRGYHLESWLLACPYVTPIYVCLYQAQLALNSHKMQLLLDWIISMPVLWLCAKMYYSMHFTQLVKD